MQVLDGLPLGATFIAGITHAQMPFACLAPINHMRTRNCLGDTLRHVALNLNRAIHGILCDRVSLLREFVEGRGELRDRRLLSHHA